MKRPPLNHSIKTGLSFGLTSGIVTSLGLMVGLFSGTHSKLAVLGGLLTIAVADAFSDAMGIHVAEETEGIHGPKEIWQATLVTFLGKFIFSLTFVLPVLLFSLATAVTVSIVWGFSLLSLFSWKIARSQKRKPWQLIIEHLLVAAFVVVVTHFLGRWIASTFG